MDGKYGREKGRKKDSDSRTNSPDCSKVRILKPSIPSQRVTSPVPAEHVASPVIISQSPTIAHNASHSSAGQLQLQQQQTQQQQNQNLDEIIEEVAENTPKVLKLLDTENWTFLEHPAVDYLFGDNVSSGLGGFTVMSAIGMQSVGKSSLLNKIAGFDVFKTHKDNGENDLLVKHVTQGLELHITKERLFLIDSQPVLSASLLDEYIKSSQSSNNIISDISEPETYIYITSLQIVSCLLAISDYVIVVCDWAIDFHLIKLIATAIMMVGSNVHRAEIVLYYPKGYEGSYKKVNQTLHSLIGRDGLTVVEDGDDLKLFSTVMKVPSRRNFSNPTTGSNNRNALPSSEKSWLVSAQRFWENSIRKSTLYSDYVRFMP